MLHLASLPPPHPLHQPVCIHAKQYIKMHRSPLHELAHIYEILPQDIETVPLPAFPPSFRLGCMLTIPALEEESAAHESSC